MSHWNYRVIHKRIGDSESYEIHEVYYDDNGSIETWTVDAVEPHGETLSELRGDLGYFLKAFQKPVLELSQNEGQETLEPAPLEAINPGHYFEFMDRAWVALDYLYQYLGSHPLMHREERLAELYDKAETALAELYQEAGRLEFGRDEGDTKPEA